MPFSFFTQYYIGKIMYVLQPWARMGPQLGGSYLFSLLEGVVVVAQWYNHLILQPEKPGGQGSGFNPT